MQTQKLTTPGGALKLSVTLLVLFFTYWCVDIVSPIVPTIRDSLNLSATGAGLFFSAFFGGRLVANLPAAWFVDRRGPRLTAGLGAAILLGSSVLVALAQSELTLLPARAMQGAGVALLATAGLLSVLRALPGGGAAMTAFNVSAGIGGSVGLLLGGYLGASVGWRSVFWVSAAAAAALLIVVMLARAQPAQARVAAEADQESPSHAPSAMWLAVVANFLVFSNYSIWVLGIPLLASSVFGLNATEVGVLLLLVNLVHLAAAFPAGFLIRRVGAPAAMALGFGVAGLGMVLAPWADTPIMFVGPLALYAIGQVAGNSAAGDLILRLGGGEGRAVGAVRLSSDVGMVVGPALAGGIVDAAGVTAPFNVLGAISLACMTLVMLLRYRVRRPARPGR